MADEQKKGHGVSRRGFLTGIGTGAVATAILPQIPGRPVDAQIGPNEITETRLSLRINGTEHKLAVEPRTTLLSALRDQLNLTGTKQVCDRGTCGGCTVIVDGKTVYACMSLAIDMEGKDIRTVEGLADGDRLHPIQEAFIEKDALMCGFCTPGFVMSVAALLGENPDPSMDDIKLGVSGNICRCGTYPRVFEAALAAAQKMKKGV